MSDSIDCKNQLNQTIYKQMANNPLSQWLMMSPSDPTDEKRLGIPVLLYKFRFFKCDDEWFSVLWIGWTKLNDYLFQLKDMTI